MDLLNIPKHIFDILPERSGFRASLSLASRYPFQDKYLGPIAMEALYGDRTVPDFPTSDHMRLPTRYVMGKIKRMAPVAAITQINAWGDNFSFAISRSGSPAAKGQVRA